MSGLTVLVVDDQPLIRAGLRGILADMPDITVVAEAADGRSGVAAALAERPDVVLMDLRMPGMDGIEATRRLTSADPPHRVLVLTTFADDDLVLDALRAGALGYVLKGVDPDELAAAVRAVASGALVMSPEVAATVRRAVSSVTPADPESVRLVGRLTPRELETVALAAQGLSNDDVARRLHLSVATVRTHVARAMLKLGVRDRAGLVVVAHRARLDRPDGPAPT